jgi:signal transduction histidine kinase
LGSSAQADVTLLEQAVSNLAHNAVRYGDAGGHVAIVLRSDQARSRHPDGQGLGLHIALEVARRHGFQLDFRRSEFGGLEAEPCRA